MIKTLYPCFQHWSARGSVYLISDTHFDDHDRKFMGYNISEEEQLHFLATTCHRNDTLIHLGDVGNPDYLRHIKCYKVLIMGNHDQSASKFKNEIIMVDLDNKTPQEIEHLLKTQQIDNISYEFHSPFVRGYKNNGLFNEVYTGPLMISDKLILSHEPICLEIGTDRIPIAFNIHGHDHSGESYNDDYHLNLAQNVWGYEPLNLKEFINNGALKYIDSIHRVTIDKQIAKRQEKKYHISF